ncbi:MAG: COP23 domain-containing protein [Spirulina sp.]
MTNRSLTKILTAFGSALLMSALSMKPGNAQSESTTFFCGTYKGDPTTIARVQDINIPIVPWRTSYFSDSAWTPERRCHEISRRFQVYHQQGTLNYLTTGEVDEMPVVCAVETQRSSCQELLFTLTRNSNPNTFLTTMFKVTNNSDKNRIISRFSDRVYIDLDKYLNTILIEIQSPSSRGYSLPELPSLSPREGSSSSGSR